MSTQSFQHRLSQSDLSLQHLNYALAHLDQHIQVNPDFIQGSHFVKSWQKISGQISLHLFFNYKTQHFWAIIQAQRGCEFIPGTKDGFELIKVPLLDDNVIRNKLNNRQFPFSSCSDLIEFFKKEIRYPIVMESPNGGYTIHLRDGGLLGGGAKVSRVIAPREAGSDERKVSRDSEEFVQVHKFLLDRYKVRMSKDKDTKDEQLINKLAEKICGNLPTDQESDFEKHLTEHIDVYEEEYFDRLVLEVLEKSIEVEGKPKLMDYVGSFSSQKLCIELLRKGYFAREIAKGGVEKMISEKILAKLAEETQPFVERLEKKANLAPQGKTNEEGFSRLFGMLETKEKMESLLKVLPKNKAKKALNSIRETLGVETEDPQELIYEVCFSKSCDQILQDFSIKAMATPLTSPTSSPTRALSPETIVKVDSVIVKTGNVDSKLNQISYLENIRLSVLNELNLLDHELGTLVELHNFIKQEIIKKQSEDKGVFLPSSKHTRLDDIKGLIMSIVKGYRENEANLESNELSSLLPLAFIQDVKIFRSFMGVFLEDLRNDILFDPKKVRMLSFILISAMKNQDFKEYCKVDDLIQALKILKPKIEDLSITSENVNLQEALNSLNDILFLMGFIGAKGIKGDYLEMVKELTQYMQTHGLEQAYNVLTGTAKDPSLEIKREYAIEAFKRIEGTSFEEWQDRCSKIIQATKIAVNIGKGIFLGDASSITDALLQIKDMLVQAYADRPKTWYDHVNGLRFLTNEPVERIIAELFGHSRSYNKNYSFFAAECILTVVNQPHRKLREKKLAIQALWFLVKGYDYKQSKAKGYAITSKSYKLSKDISSYVKPALLALCHPSDIDLSVFIRKLVESPIKLEDNSNQSEITGAALKLNEKVNEEEDGGKQFYLRILREKKPRFYSLARIQEHSTKTFEKPTVLVDFRGIDKDKDCDKEFQKKFEEKIENIPIASMIQCIKELKALDTKTTGKRAFYEAFVGIIAHNAEMKETNKQVDEKEIKSQMTELIEFKLKQLNEAHTTYLLDTLEAFLDDPSKSVLLVQGDAGAGKTLLLRLFEQKLWKKYNMLVKADMKNRNRLPLRIALSEVRSFDKAVEEFLLQHGCDPEGIQEIKKEPAVILFDGYDEINQYINLYNLNKLETWKDVKVIFTSRKENLTSLKEDYVLCFTPGNDKQRVLSYNIQPVNETQIRKYFEAQADENRQKIAKLDEKLKAHKVKTSSAASIMKPAQVEVDYLKILPQSEKLGCAIEMMTVLEDRMSDLEALQKNLAGTNIEVVPLVDIFESRINKLKIVTDLYHIESERRNIEEKHLPVIQKIEHDLVELAKEDPQDDKEISEIKLKLRTLKKFTGVIKASQALENGLSLVNKITDKFRIIVARDFSHHTGPSNATSTNLRYFKNHITSAYFKETVEELKKNFEQLKQIEKKARSSKTESDNTTLLKEEIFLADLAEIENFTDFEKFQAPFQELQNQLSEFRKTELEFDREISKGKTQPEPSESLQFNAEKLKTLFSNLKVVRNKMQEGTQAFKVFRPDILQRLFDPVTDRSKFEGLGYYVGIDLRKFEERIQLFEDFIQRGDMEKSYLVKNLKLHDMQTLCYLIEVQSALKTLKDITDDIQKSMTDLRALNEGDSEIVEALQKQLSNILISDNNKKYNASIEKLEEIILDIVTLTNQYKAIKEDTPAEELAIKVIRKQVKDLQNFTDSDSLSSLIQRFKDIITSPFMLKMLMQTLLKYPKSSANKAELYRLFAMIHFEREKEKLLQTEKIPPKFNIIDSFTQYSKDLAVNMFMRKVTSLQAKSSGYKVLGIIEIKKSNIWTRFFDESDIMVKLSRRGAQIIEDDGVVRFLHKSIMEYFAARQFYDEIIDYNADNEDYDPCLNKGPIIDNETAVYSFLKDIIDSAGAAKDEKEEFTVFEKKLLEIFGSTILQKQYGNNLDTNFFYPNLFLILLLNDKLITKISEMKEGLPALAIIRNIFKWIFSDSETSYRFIKMIDQTLVVNSLVYDNLRPLVHVYYNFASRQDSGMNIFKDRFITAKREVQNKVSLYSEDMSSQTCSLFVKDNKIVKGPDEAGSDSWSDEEGSDSCTDETGSDSWIIDGKLFIHGSLDSIVTVKDANSNQYLAFNPKYNLIDERFVLDNTKNPWDVPVCKWIFRMNDYRKLLFELVSITDPSESLNGHFKNIDEYHGLFKDLCSSDIHSCPISDKSYICQTCSVKEGPPYVCNKCIDHCHAGHQFKEVAESTSKSYGRNNGYCVCRFTGLCQIANGCTARFPDNNKKKNLEMYKCTECPNDKKNIVLCLACKKHHQEECNHEVFDKVTDGGACQCNCIESRTRILAQSQGKGIVRGQTREKKKADAVTEGKSKTKADNKSEEDDSDEDS